MVLVPTGATAADSMSEMASKGAEEGDKAMSAALSLEDTPRKGGGARPAAFREPSDEDEEDEDEEDEDEEEEEDTPSPSPP